MGQENTHADDEQETEVIIVTDKTFHTIRTSLLSMVAVAAIAAPVFVSAAVNNTDNPNAGILKAERVTVKNDSPEFTYAKLQDKTRNVCGSSNVRMTGDLRRSSQNAKCYEGTLDSAVLRLDDPAVTALHQDS